jgi:hypothetical protein
MYFWCAQRKKLPLAGKCFKAFFLKKKFSLLSQTIPFWNKCKKTKNKKQKRSGYGYKVMSHNDPR